MDIRKIDGMWCDDITFCQEECSWMNCPRNSKNIRDKTIPHSFSVEIPMDCPKKVGKEISSRIMDDVGNIINEITTRVVETQDEFIFQTISGWWENSTQMVISKKELTDALTLHKKLVRCKDCKHGFRLDDTNYIVCGRPFASNRETHTEEWFCADGKRKEE